MKKVNSHRLSKVAIERFGHLWKPDNPSWLTQRKNDWKSIRLQLESAHVSIGEPVIIAIRDFYIDKKPLPKGIYGIPRSGYFLYLLPCESRKNFQDILEFLFEKGAPTPYFFMEATPFALPRTDWYIDSFFGVGFQDETIERFKGVDFCVEWAKKSISFFEKQVLSFLTDSDVGDYQGLPYAIDYWLDCCSYLEGKKIQLESRNYLLPMLDVIHNFYEPRGYIERQSLAMELAVNAKEKLENGVQSVVVTDAWKRVSMNGGYIAKKKDLAGPFYVRDEKFGKLTQLPFMRKTIFDMDQSLFLTQLIKVLLDLSFIDDSAIEECGWFDIDEHIDEKKKGYFGLSSEDTVLVYKIRIPLNKNFTANNDPQSGMTIEILWFNEGAHQRDLVEGRHDIKGIIYIAYDDYYHEFLPSPSVILKWWHICKQFERASGIPLYDYTLPEGWGKPEEGAEFYKPALDFEFYIPVDYEDDDYDEDEEPPIYDDLNAHILNPCTSENIAPLEIELKDL